MAGGYADADEFQQLFRHQMLMNFSNFFGIKFRHDWWPLQQRPQFTQTGAEYQQLDRDRWNCY
jgi:hypothetical protein